MQRQPADSEPPADRSPETDGGTGETQSHPGRIARARRSAEELERRARDELERARRRHTSVRLAIQAFERDRAKAGGLLAGGLAYRVFLWQIPLALFLMSTFGLVTELSGSDPSDLAKRAGMTAALSATIAKAVTATNTARWWLLILAAFLMVWAGRGVYRGVRLVSELAWDTRGPRGNSLLGSFVVTGLGLAFIAMQVFLPKVMSTLAVPGLARFILGIAAALVLSVWALSLLPRGDAPWTAVVPGAVTFAAGVRILGLAASTYFAFRLDRSSDLYGAIGIAIVMMLYLFLLARLFVAVLFLNAALYRRREPGASLPS